MTDTAPDVATGSKWFDPEMWRALQVAVIVAHPDDEVLGCGGLVSRLPNVRVVHVTDGAPRNPADAQRHGFGSAAAYAEARAHEAEAALALAGVPADRIMRLGFADQTASEHLPAIARALAAPIAAADIVLTHAYEGGHSDHDAVAFAVYAACRLVTLDDARAPAPRHKGGLEPGLLLLEMPFYHAASEGWVRQRFLPVDGAAPEVVLALTPDEADLKRRMLATHRTQADTLGSFDVTAERFRPAPAYDFARAPHTGEMLYERHGWNLTGAQWLERVRAARADLRLDP